MDELKLEELMKRVVKRAKARVIMEYEGVADMEYEGVAETKRSWLESSPQDSYREQRYRVTVYVLEGSPPKGYVVAFYGLHMAVAFSHVGRRLCTFQGMVKW